MKSNTLSVALITGAARRIGATIAKTLHENGFNVVIHYCHSKKEAESLCAILNKKRSQSAIAMHVDFIQSTKLSKLINRTIEIFGRLDLLVNNASEFIATTVGNTTETQWHQLIDINLKASYFLAQSAAPYLANTKGSIINIIDIHGQIPLKGYSVYSISKAGLSMLTKSLARELGPQIRVNAIAPGITLWPENENAMCDSIKTELIERTALKRKGSPQDIADAVLFFTRSTSITGQILNIDAGRLLRI